MLSFAKLFLTTMIATTSILAQTTTHSSTKVEGHAIVMHIWGRTATVKIRQMDVIKTHPDQFRINVIADQPVIDGVRRKGYFFPVFQHKLTVSDDTTEQTIVSEEELSLGLEEEDLTIVNRREAKITFRKGTPTKVVFTETNEAKFDVAEYRKKMLLDIAALKKKLAAADPADADVITFEIAALQNAHDDLAVFDEQNRQTVIGSGTFGKQD